MDDINRLLGQWRIDADVAANIAAWKTIPAQAAKRAAFPADMHPALIDALKGAGIRDLYTHQLAAWEHIQRGKNVVIVTGTASGKTLCYNLPVLDSLLRDDESRALYVFPTKALAQDQKESLSALVEEIPQLGAETPWVGTYDGDTPADARKIVRTAARAVITNPDMLHTGVLPHHTLWEDFFRNLHYVILDEIHLYRGVFGSHIANLIRRLKRVCRFYKAQPAFILTSATIANPTELAGHLIEETVNLVDQDGSGRGEKHFLIYNPPVVDKDMGYRRSSLMESVTFAQRLYDENIQTLLFGRTRRSVEILVKYLHEAIPESGEKIRGYRSGYLPRHRREIERGLREGSIRLVAATNALELGIDIGGVQASLLCGYPGTIAGTWQQAGRAGRKDDAALALMVTSPNPLDQFLAHNPEYFFGKSPENALIDANNPLILLQHVRCAAFELPFKNDEPFGSVSGEAVLEYLNFLAESGTLHENDGRYYWMADQYPASQVSLRSASPDNVRLLLTHEETEEGGRLLGIVDSQSAHWMVHPGAVYLHEGQTYEVTALDLEQGVAHLRTIDDEYYTEPVNETDIQLEEKLAEKPSQGAVTGYGEITVTTRVTAFRKIRWYTNEHLGGGEVTLPETTLRTTGYWLALEEQTVEKLRQEGSWSSDPNDYGPGWDRLREAVRQRDGFRCQVCGLPEYGKAHHVHHKVPFRNFTSLAEANRMENLVTLCPACHRRVETAVRMRSGLAGLAYVLGHLCPIFLMCDQGDIGVHFDPQSPLSESRPVVVIYDQVPAGIGFSQKLYEVHSELIGHAMRLVAACECAEGCPSCVGPAGEKASGGKAETMAILKELIA